MSQSVTICHECVDKTGRPKRWNSLCVDCSEDTIRRHRQATGHTDIELRVVTGWGH